MDLFISLNSYGTHAEVDAAQHESIRPLAHRVKPGESYYGIPYTAWCEHVGGTIDLLALQWRHWYLLKEGSRPRDERHMQVMTRFRTWIEELAADRPVRLAGYICLISGFLVTLISWRYWQRNFSGFLENILIEAHGMVLDLLVIGWLVFWINQLAEKRLTIKRYNEEIEDFLGWEGNEAKFRIIGLIRRLNGLHTRPAKLHRAFLVEGELENVDLRGVDLRDAHLESASLNDANLEGADLRGAFLHKAQLRHANLKKVDLRGANLSGMTQYFPNQILLYEDMPEQIQGDPGALMAGANLEGADCRETQFYNARLYNVNLTNAQLERANLAWADLRTATLTGAHLHQAFLWRADLRDADFAGATLTDAYLKKADLRGARNLTVEQLNSAYTLDEAQIDEELISQLNR
jgi:uncharacterized protein YjbI with pentapeptide repeats